MTSESTPEPLPPEPLTAFEDDFERSPATERPNLLLILTDHWRGDCLGRLGHAVAETPHLDSLSADGATFTHAYTPSPSCTPARRCLMTGLTPNSAGMVGYRDGVPWNYDTTFAGELAKGGYQTINVGKTHFWPERLRLGFEELIVPDDYDEWLEGEVGMVRGRVAHGVPANSWMARPNYLPETQQEETWFTNEALKRLEKRDPTRPFFLTLSFNGPHPPWCPPQVYYDQFINREMPPPVVGDWAEHHDREARRPMDVNAWRGRVDKHLNQRARAAYFAYLAYLDAQVGRTIEWLERNGQMANTMIAFTSDHGEMLGDHHLWRKTYPYEASARVPMIIRPPGGMDAQRNVELEQVVGWEDLMPTFLAAAGLPIPETVEGRSMMPLLRRGHAPWRDFYHHEHAPCYHREACYQALTDRDWKYIWNPTTGAEQLFHLAEDPDECQDLASVEDHARRLTTWRRKLARHLVGRPEGWSDGETLTPGDFPAWREDE